VLTDYTNHATAAASDLGRARRWCEDKLGLVPDRGDSGGVWYRFAGDKWLYLYATGSAGTARNTIAGGTVRGIEAEMSDLRGRGVVFEDYDTGELKTVDGLADARPPHPPAWFVKEPCSRRGPCCPSAPPSSRGPW
jgi:hypothetical protein